MGGVMMWGIWLSRYLMVGLICVLFFDWLIKRVTDQEFTNGERVSVILFWPVMIVSFIWGWFGNGDNNG